MFWELSVNAAFSCSIFIGLFTALFWIYLAIKHIKITNRTADKLMSTYMLVQYFIITVMMMITIMSVKTSITKTVTAIKSINGELLTDLDWSDKNSEEKHN